MAEREPNLINSSLSRQVNRDGITVRVEIYRLEDVSGWTLEVVNERGTSTVWDDQFATDDAAEAAFNETVSAEGISNDYPGVEDIRVIGIDLTQRGIDTKATKAAKAAKKAAKISEKLAKPSSAKGHKKGKKRGQ